MINFDYVRPSTQKAAIDALNKDATSQFIAGGTNLVDLMKRGVNCDLLSRTSSLLFSEFTYLINDSNAPFHEPNLLA